MVGLRFEWPSRRRTVDLHAGGRLATTGESRSRTVALWERRLAETGKQRMVDTPIEATTRRPRRDDTWGRRVTRHRRVDMRVSSGRHAWIWDDTPRSGDDMRASSPARALKGRHTRGPRPPTRVLKRRAPIGPGNPSFEGRHAWIGLVTGGLRDDMRGSGDDTRRSRPVNASLRGMTRAPNEDVEGRHALRTCGLKGRHVLSNGRHAPLAATTCALEGTTCAVEATTRASSAHLNPACRP
jgi:hypothetical protein